MRAHGRTDAGADDRDGAALPDLSLREVGRRLRAGRTTSLALVDAHLERIAARDPDVLAFVALDAERARTRAARADAELDAGIDRGPLHGVPCALKDLIDMAGTRTTCGSHRHAARVPDADAAVVTRLLAAGAVPLGKLATYEYALTGPSLDQPHPPPRNPWNPAHVTGGSSSGPAAAVAAGLVRFALGTDTGGSVRSSACYCGVVGLKPTFGALPMQGIHPLAPSLDHVGILAASVAEAWLAFEVLAGRGRDGSAATNGATARGTIPGEGALAGLRIGYARDWFAHDAALAPGVPEAMDAAVSTLSSLGARISAVALPDYASLERAGATLIDVEAFATHREAMTSGRGGYGRQARLALQAGRTLDEADRTRALAAGARFREALEKGVFAHHDALVTVCALAPAPPFSAFRDDRPVWTPMRTLPFNLGGQPALAVPIGLSGRAGGGTSGGPPDESSGGLPLGMQIVGRAGAEATICRVGEAFERAVPPLSPTASGTGLGGSLRSGRARA